MEVLNLTAAEVYELAIAAGAKPIQLDALIKARHIAKVNYKRCILETLQAFKVECNEYTTKKVDKLMESSIK